MQKWRYIRMCMHATAWSKLTSCSILTTLASPWDSFFCVLCLPVLFPVLCSVLSLLLFLLLVLFFDLACIVPLCFFTLIYTLHNPYQYSIPTVTATILFTWAVHGSILYIVCSYIVLIYAVWPFWLLTLHPPFSIGGNVYLNRKSENFISTLVMKLCVLSFGIVCLFEEKDGCFRSFMSWLPKICQVILTEYLSDHARIL